MRENPLQEVEKIAKNLNDIAHKHTRPVLRRYPLLFGLFVTFGASAILEGFRLFIEKIEFFKNYPFVLIFTGVILLIFTGMLYKKLETSHE